jgi:hypothetical protein
MIKVSYIMSNRDKLIAILKVFGKYWRSAFGGLSIAALAWMLALGYITETRAFGVAIVLWTGGFVNRRIDPLSIWKRGGESGTG